MSCLTKFLRQTFCLHHPNSSTPGKGRYHISDPWGPHRSLKTTRHTPQIDLFSLSCFYMVKVMSCLTKFLRQTFFLHHPNSSTPGKGRYHICDPWGPNRSPKTTRHTPQIDPFSHHYLGFVMDARMLSKLYFDTRDFCVEKIGPVLVWIDSSWNDLCISDVRSSMKNKRCHWELFNQNN